MELAELFKTLGDENRLRVLNLLMAEELCVCEIEVILGITQSNASRHLAKLKNRGLIVSARKAQWIYYRINSFFKQGAPFLYNYLLQEMQKNPCYLHDMARLAYYRACDYNCDLIHTDKDGLIRLLEKELPLLEVCTNETIRQEGEN